MWYRAPAKGFLGIRHGFLRWSLRPQQPHLKCEFVRQVASPKILFRRKGTVPIYDFRCRECGKVSELFLRGADNQVVCCPDCGSEKLERLISASYMIKTSASAPGTTCCGRTERCETPPCSTGDVCHRS